MKYPNTIWNGQKQSSIATKVVLANEKIRDQVKYFDSDKIEKYHVIINDLSIA